MVGEDLVDEAGHGALVGDVVGMAIAKPSPAEPQVTTATCPAREPPGRAAAGLGGRLWPSWSPGRPWPDKAIQHLPDFNRLRQSGARRWCRAARVPRPTPSVSG